MRGDEEDLERVLDHAPAMVLARVPGAEEALLVSSASIVGGFRALVIDLATADAVDVLASLVPRHDTIVGCLSTGDANLLADAMDAGATFVLDPSDSVEVAHAVHEAGRTWIPRILTTDRGGRKAHVQERWGWYEPGGFESFHDVVASAPERSWLAGPAIPGDRIGEWIDAGARAVVLSEAIYSSELLEQGDRRAIRDYAAAVHREATRSSRVARSRG